MSRSVVERVHELLEPLADQQGFELVAVEVAGSAGSPILRVYLDRDGGIDLDALTGANAWIDEALENDPPLEGQYVLEVSSPGVDRPLRRTEDFERFIGERAQVKTHAPVDGRRTFTGTIAGLEDDRLVLDCEDGRQVLPLEGFAKANLKSEITIDNE